MTNTRCRCPIGFILGDCPFSYANGWHATRAEILLRTEITPKLTTSIETERAARASDPIKAELLQYPINDS